jgi:hypothetical protein
MIKIRHAYVSQQGSRSPQALDKSEWEIRNAKHRTETSKAKNTTQKTNQMSKTNPTKQGVKSGVREG